MSRKVIESKSTGIYRRVRTHITFKTKKGKFSPRDLKSFVKLSRQINEGFDLKRLLGQLEAVGKRVIKAHGGKLKLKERLPSGGIRETILWLPEDAPPIAHDARELLFEIVCLRDWVGKNHAENAALYGFRLGRIAEKINIRPFEAVVKTGSGIRKGLHKGRETKGRKFEREVPKWQREGDSMVRKNPHLKWTTVCDRIAAQWTNSGFRVSGRTVRNRTKYPRKFS